MVVHIFSLSCARMKHITQFAISRSCDQGNHFQTEIRSIHKMVRLDKECRDDMNGYGIYIEESKRMNGYFENHKTKVNLKNVECFLSLQTQNNHLFIKFKATDQKNILT